MVSSVEFEVKECKSQPSKLAASQPALHFPVGDKEEIKNHDRSDGAA